MNLDDAPESSNVQDSRGMGSTLALGGGGGLVLLILGLIFGKDFLANIPDLQQPDAPVANTAQDKGQDDKTLHFTRKILGTTEAVWNDEFRKLGKPYTPPHLELFRKQVQTGCGLAPASVGPFYCPADRKVYLDPTF